jgi:hypothetical protein
MGAWPGKLNAKRWVSLVMSALPAKTGAEPNRSEAAIMVKPSRFDISFSYRIHNRSFSDEQPNAIDRSCALHSDFVHARSRYR